MIKQLFLPVGLILAVATALLFPGGGQFITDNHGLKLFIFIIFLVSGYQTGSRSLTLDWKLLLILFVASIISLFLAPLLGVAFSQLLQLSLPLTMGLIIMATVPPTISSCVVITELSGGNAVLALFLTIAINIIGTFTLPFVLDISLKTAGAIDIDQIALLIKMVLLILLPFLIGKTVRSLSEKESVSPRWSYINSSCVILTVYTSAATSRDALTGLTLADFTLIIGAVAMVHLSLLLINWLSGIKLRLKNAENKAMLFVTSQKTLATALVILASIQVETGSAIIVCLAFHFFQLFIDSALAGFLLKKS